MNGALFPQFGGSPPPILPCFPPSRMELALVFRPLVLLVLQIQMANTVSDTAKIKALLAEGYGYKRLSAALDIPHREAIALCRGREFLRERDREQNAKRRAAKRAWEQQQLANCPVCGGPMHYRNSLRCAHCRAAAISQATTERRAKILALWNEGLTLKAVARAMNSTPASIGVEINRMRRAGMDVPFRQSRKEAA